MKHILLLGFLLLSMLGNAQDILITEIMYNPSGTDTNWEWIEIYNESTDTIDLTGYVFDDNASTALTEANINEGTLGPQSSAILFNARNISAQQFRDVWGNVNTIEVAIWPTLGNGGDAIALWSSFESYEGDHRNQQNAVEQLAYDNNDIGWPDDDGMSSIFLTDLEVDNSNGINWSLSTDGAETPVNINYTSIELHGNSGNDIGSPGILGSVDTELPIIFCPEDIEMAADIDNCGATLPFLIPTGSDNITEELVFEGIRSDDLELTDIYPIGLTTITWTAIDEAGNVSEPCEQQILIQNDFVPSINCPDAIELLSEDGNPIVIDIDFATASNVCGGSVTVTGTRSDEKELEEPFSVGETRIMWQATDESGNIAECEQLVVVNFNASTENDITSFSIPNQVGVAIIDTENKTVVLTLPFGSDVSNLIPIIEISEAATINPGMGVQIDFSNSVIYTVTSQDGTEQLWTITVEIEEEVVEEEENPNKLSITSFMLVNADTNDDLFLIEEGMVIDINDLPTVHLDIRANTTEDVESVRLSLNGIQSASRTENVAPYALFGDSPSGNYNGSDFSEGTYIVTAIPYSENNLGGEMGEVLTLNFEFLDEPIISITDFVLINADTNEDLLTLTEGLQIDISTLPTLNLDIRANTNEGVESVQLQLEGSIDVIRTENLAPYALFGDLPLGNYNGTTFKEGSYRITAFPFAEDALNGAAGDSLTINFELVSPTPVLSISSFTLVNGDTNEDIMDLTDGIQIDLTTLPTLNLDIRANASEEVASVFLTLSGAQSTSRTENVSPYALFGDFPTGNYNGNDFEEGLYVINATGYSEDNLSGDMGESLSIEFQLITEQTASKQANRMSVYPNPASSELTLRFDNPEELTIIYVYDVLGRILGQYKGSNVVNAETYVLDVNDIPAGSYYIESRNQSGKKYQKQIVIKK